MMFLLLEYDYLSEDQENLIISFEQQFLKKDYLTEPQQEILADIFEKAAGNVEWSRWEKSH